MNSIKCGKCGLSNFAGEEHCRRCSAQLPCSAPLKKEKRPRRISIISLVFYGAVIFGGYHLYEGAKSSIDEVNANDAHRVATQPTVKAPPAGISRSEQERRHATHVGNSVEDSPSFQAKRKQEEETQKAIRQASEGR